MGQAVHCVEGQDKCNWQWAFQLTNLLIAFRGCSDSCCPSEKGPTTADKATTRMQVEKTDVQNWSLIATFPTACSECHSLTAQEGRAPICQFIAPRTFPSCPVADFHGRGGTSYHLWASRKVTFPPVCNKTELQFTWLIYKHKHISANSLFLHP